MGSMNIAIKKEAYDFLKELKGEEKSFSDVILSFKQKNDITRLFGALKHKDWSTTKENMRGLREDFEKR